MRHVTLAALALSVPLAAACGSSDGGGGGGGAADAAPAELADARYGDGYSITWGPVTLDPLSEDTRCIQKRLSNEEAIKVGKIHNVLGNASHHLIVYRLTEGEEILEPTPCNPFEAVIRPDQGAPLGITQIPDEEITLPPGVAFTFQPNQLIRLEMHYLNATTEPIQVEATSTFIEIPDEDFRDEADFLFVGNPDIDIAPQSSQTVGPGDLPLPLDLADINVFAITGHQHQWGTGVNIERFESAGGPGEVIYAPEDFVWDEPPTEYFRPALTMPQGSGFRFTCTFQNQSDQQVGFGEGANDEMCFFWAYYYPSQGPRVCVHTKQIGGAEGYSGCCPGDPLCALIEDL